MEHETRPEDWRPDRALDLAGLKCPLPVLKARKALSALPVGGRLMVTATDPVAAVDMPHFAAESGHRIVASAEAGGKLMFLIEKG